MPDTKTELSVYVGQNSSALQNEHEIFAAATTAPFACRVATLCDLPYIDDLQKKHGHQLGFLPTEWLSKSITKDHVVIAFENGEPAAYLLGKARYKCQDDVGIIYQACVQYDAQRRLLGTALVLYYLKRMPATTNLVGLWCAEDLEANLFWEALGFRPLGWRAGSRAKGRAHIYWQKLLDPAAGRKLWLPKTTSAGSMRESRVVLPFAPGADWAGDKRLSLSLPEVYVDGDASTALSGGPAAREAKRLEALRATFHQPPPGTIMVFMAGKARFVPRAELTKQTIYTPPPEPKHGRKVGRKRPEQ